MRPYFQPLALANYNRFYPDVYQATQPALHRNVEVHVIKMKLLIPPPNLHFPVFLTIVYDTQLSKRKRWVLSLRWYFFFGGGAMTIAGGSFRVREQTCTIAAAWTALDP